MTFEHDARERLELLLEAHVSCDSVEMDSMTRIRTFVAEHSDPFARENVSGHITGSAFVLDPLGRLLLSHHRKLGIWVQLGGHADEERLAHSVALREAQEESGLQDLTFHPDLLFDDASPRLLDVDVHTIPARLDEPEHEHHDLRFLLVTREPDSVRHDFLESHALEWVTLDEAERRCDSGIGRAVGTIRRLVG